MQTPLYDLRVLKRETGAALRYSKEIRKLVINRDRIKDDSVMDLTKRMANLYGCTDLARVMHAVYSHLDVGVSGAERIAVASCLVEVATKTHDLSAVLDLAKMASCYELGELEAIMRTVERNVAQCPLQTSFEKNPSRPWDLSEERKALAKCVHILADAFCNAEVRKIGPAVRQRPAEKIVGPMVLPGTNDLLHAQIAMEGLNAHGYAERILEVAYRTNGSRNAIEAVAKTIVRDASFYENKTRIVMQAVATNDPDTIESVANIVNQIDTSLVGHKNWPQESSPITDERITHFLMNITRRTSDPRIIQKATDIATRFSDDPLAIDTFIRAVDKYATMPEVALHIGEHIISTQGDEFELDNLYRSLLKPKFDR